MRNLICLNSNTYHGYLLDNAIDGAVRAGFSYIELAAVRGYTEHVLPEMSDSELDAIKRKLEDNNIQCIAISGHSNLMTDGGLNNFKKNIQLANRLGCKFITTSTGETHDDDTVIEDENKVITILKALSEECKENGLNLVIETHGNNYATGVSVKELAKKVNEPNFGITYDTANVIFYGNKMPYDDLEQAADYVKFIHLKDKLGPNNFWHFPAIGEGNIDMSKVFNILKIKQCEAPLSVEVEFTSEGPKDLQEVHDAVKRSMETIKKVQESL